MCYYCETVLGGKDAKGRYIRKHQAINCINWNNRASPAFKGPLVNGVANKHCNVCNMRTFHFWHANSGNEQPFLRCLKCA